MHRITLVLLAIAVTGCGIVRDEKKVFGHYELDSGSNKIVLKINSDHTFSEVVQFGGAEKRTLSGKWKWLSGSVNADPLWIPKQFAPDYIVKADTDGGPNGVKYTEPGNWIMSAEYSFGKTSLAVFPDSDVAFQKIGPQQ